eukprot:1157292-Pelagomonas_calceolata.AAC.7
MARLAEVRLCGYCTKWAWSFRASLVNLCGVGSLDSPTHTQEDCVESDLYTLLKPRKSTSIKRLFCKKALKEGEAPHIAAMVKLFITKAHIP